MNYLLTYLYIYLVANLLIIYLFFNLFIHSVLWFSEQRV